MGSAYCKMIKVAKKSKKVLLLCIRGEQSQCRRKLKELTKDGAIRKIARTLCVDPWYLSQAYYDSSVWRTT